MTVEQNGNINFIHCHYYSLIQGIVSETVLHQVLVSQLPAAKTEESIQALHSTALQVAAGATPSSVNYIKLMSPVSNWKLE